MYTDIKTYIKTCAICQRSKRDTNSHPVPLKPMPMDQVFSKWHMDILELPETPKNTGICCWCLIVYPNGEQ